VAPLSFVLFFAAAVAFEQSTLAGDSPRLAIFGAVLLGVSVGTPLVSRLEARWSAQRPRAGSTHEASS
jgi:hypothetical protein